jgi:hypothetical protein
LRVLRISEVRNDGNRDIVGLTREIDPKVKAVVSSGYSDDTDAATYQHNGFIRNPMM